MTYSFYDIFFFSFYDILYINNLPPCVGVHIVSIISENSLSDVLYSL